MLKIFNKIKNRNKKVKFLVTEKILYIANTGRPFDCLSILALNEPGLSSKKKGEENKLIDKLTKIIYHQVSYELLFSIP